MVTFAIVLFSSDTVRELDVRFARERAIGCCCRNVRRIESPHTLRPVKVAAAGVDVNRIAHASSDASELVTWIGVLAESATNVSNSKWTSVPEIPSVGPADV
jgi:hypothetical protein